LKSKVYAYGTAKTYMVATMTGGMNWVSWMLVGLTRVFVVVMKFDEPGRTGIFESLKRRWQVAVAVGLHARLAA